MRRAVHDWVVVAGLCAKTCHVLVGPKLYGKLLERRLMVRAPPHALQPGIVCHNCFELHLLSIRPTARMVEDTRDVANRSMYGVDQSNDHGETRPMSRIQPMGDIVEPG